MRQKIFLPLICLFIFLFGWIALFNASLAQARQTQNPSRLTIDRLFNSNEFWEESLGEIQWFDQGDGYTRLEASNKIRGAADLVLYSSSSGKRKVMVPATELIPTGEELPLEVESYQWSSDENRLMIFTNSRRVWRTNTRGDYWIFDLQQKTLKKLGEGLPPSSLMFAKFSPDEKKVAYVSQFNLYVEDLETGVITALTTDGTRDIINGTFDWVYEEEFFCKDGFRWSPDGKFIALWQLDATDIPDFYLVNYTDSLYSKIIPIQYPKVGIDPSACRVGVIDLENGQRTWMKIPGDTKQHYIPRMQWLGNQLVVQQLNRKQNELKIWSCDINSGNARIIYSESDPAWVDLINADLTQPDQNMNDLLVMDNGHSLIRMTEKDGWRHLYQFPAEGGHETLLTPGNYDVACIYSVDEKHDWIYINASPDNSTERYLFKIDLKHPAMPQRVTPDESSGIHKYDISPDSKYAIHTYSNANTPPTVDLISLPGHKKIRSLVTNNYLKDKIKSLDLPQYEFFKITTADSVQMDGKVLKPIDFDPHKKYPVLFYVYGEPWEQEAIDEWSFDWNYLLVQQGYIIIIMDNRGTPCLKGSAWRKSIYKKIGILNSHDQAMGLKEILKWPFIDPDRIAVWGWSGGGSTTLNLLFRYPELYKTGMAVAPVTNQLYYDNIYEERYMGLVSENPEAYEEGSPINFAKNLQGNLLLVHGTGDDNVHYQNTAALINELIRQNKQFQVMIYPNRTHSIYIGRNTRRHLYTLLYDYLTNHVPPGGK